MTIKSILLKHKPCITIKSYTTHVHGCSCERFRPDGDDAASWQSWAAHVELAIKRAKHKIRQDEWRKWAQQQLRRAA